MSARVPELRFKKFKGEWKGRKLSYYLSPRGERNKEYEFDKKDVLSVSGEEGVVNQIEHMGRSYAGVDVRDYHIVRTGDVVYTKSPLKMNPFGIIRVNHGPPGIVSTLYSVYVVKDNADPRFVDRFFELDDRTNAYLRPLVHKGAKNDMKISTERVLIDPVHFPEKPEQRRIADALDAVDAKLDALSREREALAEWKRGLANRLFDQTLRFRRDDGTPFPDWEQKTLGKIATFAKGRGVSKAETEQGGATPCIRYAEIYTTYGPVIKDIVSTTPESPDDLLLSRGGEVIVPASGEDASEIATAAVVLPVGVAFGGDVNVITPNCNGAFLARYIRHNWRDFARYAQGNSVVHLYGSHLRNIDIRLPHPDEQAKIANALAVLDERLAALDARRDGIARFKTGLLQGLFV